ncbi:MAG TPA: hypothetical protein VHJ76_06175 [Actinomycetota bacterium]|nr:hypothetical protein [Actinomycetota bacterium]
MTTRRRVSRAAAALLVAAVWLVAASAPAAAQGRPQVRHDTYVSDDPVRPFVASCISAGTTVGARHTGTLTGFVAPPITVAARLGCGIVQNGRTVYYTQTALPGAGAATASTFWIPVDDYTVCLDFVALFVDGAMASYNGCP